MKIIANVEVSYWQQPSMRSRPSQRSSLTVGRETTSEQLFMLLQNSSSITGCKYKVVGNIKQMFTRYVKEGKATIRFIEPPHDLSIRCDDKLIFQSFLSVLKEGVRNKGKVPETKLSSLYSTAALPKKQTVKMLVTSKSEYPYLGEFPRTLKQLAATGIGLKVVEQKIVCLKNLVHLDLSDNLISQIPQALGSLPLAMLNLSKNKIGDATVNWSFLDGVRLSRSLQKLNLGYNQIGELPGRLANLRELVSLNVENNNLQLLPNNVALLSKLKYLHMSDNEVQYFPGSVRKMRLEVLDVSNNKFLGRDCLQAMHQNGSTLKGNAMTLAELAARVVVNQRVRYHGLAPQTVARYLDSALFCNCGSACFEHSNTCVSDVELRDIAISVVTAGGTAFFRRAPVVCTLESFCSTACALDKQTGILSHTPPLPPPPIGDPLGHHVDFYLNEFFLMEMID